jgi:pimeloyl-ACP methyl ester carboxylesterase
MMIVDQIAAAIGVETHETAPNLFVELGALRYAYRRFGVRGGTPILFLQHFRGTMDSWDPAVIDAIAKYHEVILFDNAGVGGSTGAPSRTIAASAYHVAAFASALGLESVDIFGFSMGGFIAQQLALDRPSLVRRLILAGTGPEGGERIDWRFTQDVASHVGADNPGPEDLMYVFFAHTQTSQRAAREFVRRLGARTAEPDAPSTLQVREAQTAAIAAWGAPNGGDYSKLRHITQPALVVNGVYDIVVPAVNSWILAANLPNATLIVYPDAGHGSLYQYADSFTEQALRFLRP